MKADITGKTVVILFCIGIFALLLFLIPPVERGFFHSFISLVFIGAVPVLPCGIKRFIRLKPDIYSFSAISLLPSLALGFYHLYENDNVSSAFFLPICFLLLSCALLSYLLKLNERFLPVFNRIAFVLSAVLPVTALLFALLLLFNDFSPSFAARVFACIQIYIAILTNLIFCIAIVLPLIKK